MNKKHSSNVARDLQAFIRCRAKRDGCGTADAVRDLLTDLRHFCDARRIDFYQKLDGSYDVYLEERAAWLNAVEGLR